MARDNWTKEQLIIALNLYWKIPYNKISGSSNQRIISIAPLINRTPAALAYKLMNFTSLDPEKQKIGNKGKSAASYSDKEVWDQYFGKWDQLALDSSIILSEKRNITLDKFIDLEDELEFEEGKDKERIIKTRVNQNDFRLRVLASYNEKCCITGLSLTSLLIASHIIPWSINKVERLNPQNGLCLNNIHDKAFDKGLITITTDYKVKLSKIITDKKKDLNIQKYFLEYQNQSIILPDRFLPSQEFLKYHNENIFNK